MKRRTALDIKKKIIVLLKERELSFRELEKKVNTNYKTIRTQVNELEYFGFVKVTTHERNKGNGRPFKSVRLVRR